MSQANGADEHLIGALVSSRFEYATLGRNGRVVIVTAPPPSRTLIVNYTNEDGRRLGARSAASPDDAYRMANAYLDQPVDEIGGWGPGQFWIYGETYGGLTFVPEIQLLEHIKYLTLVRAVATVGEARRLLADGYALPEPDEAEDDRSLYSIHDYDDQPVRIDQLGVENWLDERIDQFVEYRDDMGGVPTMIVPIEREGAFIDALARFGYPNVRRDDLLIGAAL